MMLFDTLSARMYRHSLPPNLLNKPRGRVVTYLRHRTAVTPDYEEYTACSHFLWGIDPPQKIPSRLQPPAYIKTLSKFVEKVRRGEVEV